MPSFQQFCTLAIALSFCPVLMASASAQTLRTPSSTFNDISNHWAALCIEGIGTSELMRGYPDGNFRPHASMTRAEFAAVIVKAFPDTSQIRSAPNFLDIAPNFWGRQAIATAYEKGFLSGYPDNRFRPNLPITRVQAMTIISNAIHTNAVTSAVGQSGLGALLQAYFDDADAIPNYAKAAVATAASQALVVNYPNARQFRPNDNMTRGEATALLCRRGGERDDARYYVPAQYLARSQSQDSNASELPVYLGDEHVIQTFENGGVAGLLHTTATLGNRLFFFLSEGEKGTQMWSSDGTTAGTTVVLRLKTEDEQVGDQHPEVIATSPQRFWLQTQRFDADLPGPADGLWGSDGTAEGTQPIEELRPDLASTFATSSNLEIATQPFQQRLPFTLIGPGQTDGGQTGGGQTGGGQTELWLSDGTTEAGTERLLLLEQTYPLSLDLLTPAGEQFFFQAIPNDSLTPALWRSDGTAEGTVRLQDLQIWQIAHASGTSGNRVYISAESSEAGAELWISDGSMAGKQRLKDIHDVNLGSGEGSSPRLLGQWGDRFFGLANAPDGFELWASEGTPETTVRIKRLSDRPIIWPQQDPFSVARNHDPVFAIHNDQLFFSLPVEQEIEGNLQRRYELWVTDGSELGTQRLATTAVPPGISAEGLTAYRDRLFFSWAGPDGRELWVTDGTPSGTRQVIDLIAGVDLIPLQCPPPPPDIDLSNYCQPEKSPRGSWPRSLTVHGDWLYFIVNDGDLFRTNGTAQGTQHVYRFDGWPYGTFPPNIVRLKDKLLVMGYEAELKLWALPE